MKIASAITFIAATLFGGATLAQPAPPPKNVITAAKAPAEDPKVAECRKQNSDLHRTIIDLFNKAQKAGKIDSKELEAFKASEASLKKLAEDLKKGGLTLAECQQYGAELAKEKAKVEAMAKAAEGAAVNDSKVAECRKKNSDAHKAVMDSFNTANKAGKIDPKEMEAFKASEASLKKHYEDLNKGGLTLAECDKLGAEIAKEKIKVEAMAKTSEMAKAATVAKAAVSDPKLTECVAKNVAEHKTILEIFVKAQKAGKIDSKELEAFTASEANLKKLAEDLKKGGLTLAECQQYGAALAKEKTKVEAMAKAAEGAAVNDGKVAECVAKNVAEHKTILEIFNKAKRDGKVDASAAGAFAASEAALAKLLLDLKKGGVTLAECQTYAAELAKEKVRAEKLAAAPMPPKK